MTAMHLSRRKFLVGSAAAALVAAPWAKTLLNLAAAEDKPSRHVNRIDLFIVQNPVPAFGGGNWTFVKLTTKDGTTGWGEAYGIPFGLDMRIDVLKRLGQGHILGADPFKVERLVQKVHADGYVPPDGMKYAALSAYEMACWDIVGKQLNQPVYELLGGQYRDKIRTYTYIYGRNEKGVVGDRATVRMPDFAAQRAVQYADMGFTGVKFDPMPGTFDGEYPPVQVPLNWLRNIEETMGKVRKAVGDRLDIGLGTHAQMTTSSAIRVAKRIEPFDPMFMEEPVPAENIDEMARVARSTSVPIATGERLSSLFHFAKLVEKQAASILQVDLGQVGGILMGKKIAAMGEAYYAQISPHLWGGPMIAAASIQLDACTPNFFIQECIERLDGFHADLLKNPIVWKDGYIIPPTGPGLGIEVNEQVVRKNLMREATVQ